VTLQALRQAAAELKRKPLRVLAVLSLPKGAPTTQVRVVAINRVRERALAVRYFIVLLLLLSATACIPIGVKGGTYAPVAATAVAH
jgi:hypothetical protein